MNVLRLDHLAVSGENRDDARAYVEDALGLAMQNGGTHARFGTHNHLMGLQDGIYLEAISVDPSAPKPDRPRWFDLDNFAGAPRLTNWICAVPDLAHAQSIWQAAGDAISLERGDLRWKMAVPKTGALPFDGAFPPLIQWQGALHPVQMLDEMPAKMKQLSILHPKAEDLQALLGSISGANIRFEIADKVALVAEFDTPHGTRVLV